MSVVRDPYWEERKDTTAQIPQAFYVDLDKKKPFGFGFGVHKPDAPKNQEWKKP